MAPRARCRSPAQPLPRVPGPKLAPFTRTGRAAIEFVQELGSPSEDADSRVWKVRLQGKGPFYALKMFRFSSSTFLRVGLAGALASLELYANYFDPFNCECRAYGRLKQESREDLAVRAHGYLLLTPRQEAELTKQMAPNDSDGDNPWRRSDEHLPLPIRAIVKDLVSDHDPFTPPQVPAIWKDLQDLNRLGILVRDITVSNYLGGKLIDFSRAWTTPHPWYRALMYERDIRNETRRDAHDLHRALAEWGMAHDWRWSEISCFDEIRECGAGVRPEVSDEFDPRFYDWRKWENDRDAADAFLEAELLPYVEEEDAGYCTS